MKILDDKRRIFFLKHAERNKEAVDPQALTPVGEITAFSMGVYLRAHFGIEVESVLSSPRFKCLRTGYLMLSGIIGAEKVQMADAAHHLLQDIRSDPDLPEAAAIWEIAQQYAQKHLLTIEQALFMLPDARPILFKKLHDLRRLIDVKCIATGDHLLCGLHGAVIDMAALHFQRSYNSASSYKSVYEFETSFRELGGQMEKCEGFTVVLSGQRVTEFQLIRLPLFLKVLNHSFAANEKMTASLANI